MNWSLSISKGNGEDPDPPNNAKEFGSSMKLDGLAKIMKVLRWAVGKEKIDQRERERERERERVTETI